MEKVKLFNLLGQAVEIEARKLDKEEVEKQARKFFEKEVKAFPCFLSGYDDHHKIELGWVCHSAEKIDMVGFFGVESGFSRYIDNKVRAGISISKTGETFLGCSVFFDGKKVRFK